MIERPGASAGDLPAGRVKRLRVHSLETFGTQDGPGVRMVIFTQGCHLRCAYCHNPDTFALNGGRMMTVDELADRAIRQKPYFGAQGGVTVSGGEPTLQAGVVRELFTRLQAAGISTCLDTNGAVLDDTVKSLYARTDLVLLDVKHIDDDRHRHLTGQSNASSLAAAAWREKTGRPLWLRYVLVPGWTDDPDAVRRWAEHFAGYRSVERVEILPYHRLGVHKWEHLGLTYRLHDVAPPDAATLARVRDVFAAHFRHVVVK
jgi:pyruvate formate lyase activating enzyme